MSPALNSEMTMGLSCLLRVAVITTLIKYGLTINLSLTLLRDGVEKGAVCLDGSPPGYYMRKGSRDPNRWIVHMEGGGYCTNEEDCVHRSHTELGSSKNWTQSIFVDGFLSDNCSENPHFCGWSMALIPYCDGAVFAGNVVNPVKVGTDTIYFRGIRILDYVIEALLNFGVNKADQVVLTGCSGAGGHATYLHIDHVRKMIPDNIPLHGFADAGYFLDARNVNGEYIQRALLQAVFKMQNVTGGLNDDCLADIPTDQHWKCLFVPYMYSYIKTPVFTYNSAYDTWQLKYTLGLDCYPPNCSARQMQQLNNYGEEFFEAVSPAIQSLSNGVFIDSCLAHCQSLSAITWTQFTVNNQTIEDTLYAWLTGYKSKEVDCTPYPCNPTCPVPSN